MGENRWSYHSTYSVTDEMSLKKFLPTEYFVHDAVEESLCQHHGEIMQRAKDPKVTERAIQSRSL